MKCVSESLGEVSAHLPKRASFERYCGLWLGKARGPSHPVASGRSVGTTPGRLGPRRARLSPKSATCEQKPSGCANTDRGVACQTRPEEQSSSEGIPPLILARGGRAGINTGSASAGRCVRTRLGHPLVRHENIIAVQIPVVNLREYPFPGRIIHHSAERVTVIGND